MRTRIKLDVFPIEKDGFHIKLPVKVNGKNGLFILDTGASKTVMDVSVIHDFIDQPDIKPLEQLTSGIGTNSMEGHLVYIHELQLGKIKIKEFPCALLDLKHVNIAYGTLGLEKIVGVIGGDILQQYKAVINYSKSVLVLEDVSS